MISGKLMPGSPRLAFTQADRLCESAGIPGTQSRSASNSIAAARPLPLCPAPTVRRRHSCSYHSIYMRPFPVYPATSSTPLKLVFSLVHMERDKVQRLAFVNWRQELVARCAASKCRCRDRVGGQDLPQLLLDAITFDEEVVGSEWTSGQTGVARENDPILSQGEADNLIIPECAVVEDVDSQEPEPLREPAEHDISDEYHKNRGSETAYRRQGRKETRGQGHTDATCR